MHKSVSRTSKMYPAALGPSRIPYSKAKWHLKAKPFQPLGFLGTCPEKEEKPRLLYLEKVSFVYQRYQLYASMIFNGHKRYTSLNKSQRRFENTWWRYRKKLKRRLWFFFFIFTRYQKSQWNKEEKWFIKSGWTTRFDFVK